MPESSRHGIPHPRGGHPALVSAYESRSGYLVFVESGNSDGWIASDSTVELPE